MTEENLPQVRTEVVIAVVPAVSFFCMFTYEAGRYACLGIPAELVEIPLSRIPHLLTSMMLCVCMWLLAAKVAIHLQEGNSWAKKRGGTWLLYFLFVGPLAFLVRPALSQLLFAAGLALLMSYVYEGDAEKRGDDAVKGREKSRTIQDIGNLGFVVFVFLFFSATLHGAGRAVEYGNRKYLVSDSYPNHVIVGTYSDRFILKQFNPIKKRFRTGSILVPIDKDGATIIREVELDLAPIKPISRIIEWSNPSAAP